MIRDRCLSSTNPHSNPSGPFVDAETRCVTSVRPGTDPCPVRLHTVVLVCRLALGFDSLPVRARRPGVLQGPGPPAVLGVAVPPGLARAAFESAK